jgi:hypothetical protein
VGPLDQLSEPTHWKVTIPSQFKRFCCIDLIFIE